MEDTLEDKSGRKPGGSGCGAKVFFGADFRTSFTILYLSDLSGVHEVRTRKAGATTEAPSWGLSSLGRSWPVVHARNGLGSEQVEAADGQKLPYLAPGSCRLEEVPFCDGLQPKSDGLQPRSNGLQPDSQAASP